MFFPQLLLSIVGLCGIEGGGYPQSDLVILTSLLKNAKPPAHVTVPGMYSKYTKLCIFCIMLKHIKIKKLYP